MEMSEINNEIEQTPENLNMEKFIVFPLLGRQYTFSSRFIGEIALFDGVYPLPLMPPYVLGVINRYSVPYALFDISLLLFKTPGQSGKVLVLKDSVDRIAFLIEDVSGIADIPEENLTAIERSVDGGDLSDMVSASFNWNGGDVFVLDIMRILDRVSAEAA
jgi:purine-binding chemotaxis protein CheW